MSFTRKILDDPRRRNLAVLAAAAIATIVWAILGLAQQARETAPREIREPFFPGIVAQTRQISHIRIQSSKDVIDVVFRPERGWVVASHDDYPASFDEVRKTVIGLATLTTIEKKTARSDWLSHIDLDSPARSGKGKEITLSDDKGNVIASLIAGKTTDIGDPGGAIGLFVRRPDESQSWLARSVFEPKAEPGDWLDKQVVSVDRARISETDVDPFTGPSYAVRRDKPTDADFALVDVPKGRQSAYPGAADGVAAAISDFNFDDVRPAKDFEFSDPHAARSVSKTFDGLTVSVGIVQQGQDYWATVSAEGTGPDAQKEARTINMRASGWAYKLPAYKGQQFATTLERLLKPKEGATTAGPTTAH